MHKWLLFLFVIMLGCAGQLCAQKADSTREQVRRELEDALESFDPNNPNLNTEQLTQILQDLASHPLNINQADSDELQIIPGVNLKIARAIVKYRQDVRPFEKVDDLVNVKGIGKATLERTRPYVKVASGLELTKTLLTSSKYWTGGGEATIFSRYRQTVQRKAGYARPDSSGGFLGNPIQYYQRFNYRSDHLSLNITQQKDAGEPFTPFNGINGNTGFDYNSYHLGIQDIGKLKQLVVGDYALYFGQGMVLWTGRTFGKGRQVIGTVDRNGRGVDPYTSSQETNYYRGVAGTYGDKLQLTYFYSYRNKNASLISADTTRLPQQSGNHRTLNERAKENNLKQIVYGGHIKWSLPIGVIGATGYRTAYNKYVSGGSRLSDRYDFSGQRNSVIGLNYKFLAGPAIIFGEGGRSQNGGLGLISGVESEIGLNTELSITYRNYQKNYQAVLGNGFGESSGAPKNEQGVYMGLSHTISDNVKVSAYFDQYRFPAPRYNTSQPTQGHDWLGLVSVTINRNLQFYVQARNEIKQEEYDVQDDLGRTRTRLGDALRGSIRAQLEYQVNPKVRLRTRGEAIRSRQAGENEEYGYLLYQDLRITPTPKLTLDGRVTIYDTDSFDTRLYQFENGLLYVLNNQVLYDQGQRMYAVVDYEPLSYMEIWAKFGITIFENQPNISSGLNEIKGNKRSDVGLEVRLKF